MASSQSPSQFAPQPSSCSQRGPADWVTGSRGGKAVVAERRFLAPDDDSVLLLLCFQGLPAEEEGAARSQQDQAVGAQPGVRWVLNSDLPKANAMRETSHHPQD